MPFGIIGQTGPGMRQVVRFGDRSAGRGTFGGEFGARHCNQWGLTFAATRPSSQITLSRLVVVIIIWESPTYRSLAHLLLDGAKTGGYCVVTFASKNWVSA